MKYHIYSARRWRGKSAELITEYPCLKNYDFEVGEIFKSYVSARIRDERGRFIEQIDYRIVRVGYITIDTLEQLGELRKDVESPLIVSDGDYGPEIMIYDGYIE